MIDSGGYYDDSLELNDAVMYLRERLFEFPFSDWITDGVVLPQSRSQAVQIMAMLSQFAPGMIPREALRMAFIHNSNAQRSGKSLLLKLIIVPANGHMATQAWNPKEEELRKVLDAEVLRGSSYIVFDNTRGFVSSQVLEAFLTTPIWTGRVLTRSQMFTASNTATVFFTGNDINVSSDIKHRSLLVDLFVQEANVQERKVEKPIDDTWLMDKANRKEMLSALWAIVRHWNEAGRPLATENLRAGFERFCSVFAGMTIFAGFGDPMVEPSDVETEIDTEMADMKALVKALAESILKEGEKREEYTFQEVVNMAHLNGCFDWLLDGKDVQAEDVPGVPGGKHADYVLKADSNSRFGRLLRKYAPAAGEATVKKVRLFRLTQDRSVRFSSTGKQRHKRFVVESTAVTEP